MGTVSLFILPIIVLIIIVYGFKKKVNIYDLFCDGALNGLKMSLKIFPFLVGMIFAVNLIVDSGLISFIFSPLSNILSKFNLNIDILPMAFMRPISGTASLAILNDILTKFGPDSFIGRVASTIQGSTDTTFYVITLYFGSIGVTKIRYALKVGLFADLIGITLSFILVYLFFGM